MGFRAGPKLYKLVFEEDSDIYGLEILARGTTLRERKNFLDAFPDDGGVLDRLMFELAFFIEHVTEWNLEDEDGTPQSITVEAISALIDARWIRQIMAAWTTASNGVNEDLKKESSSGSDTATTRDLEESIPMEALQ